MWLLFVISSCWTEVNTDTKTAENVIVEDTKIEKQEEAFNQYNYVVYSAEKIKNATKLNVLFFNDSNSESIKELKKNLQQSKIHDWLVMYEIDFNTNEGLKTKYSITAPHTFVQVDNEGKAIRKWEGSKTIIEMHTALTSNETLVK